MKPDAAAQLADLLSRTNRRLRRHARRELGPLGVTPSQLRALRALLDGPLRVSDLARCLGVVPRSATSVVDGLEAGGFVERRPDPADRRATRVALTETGAGVLGRLRAGRRAGVAELLDRLSAAEQSELIRLLGRLSED
ncbi:MAG: MarR family winged helix-turn-helix transcriptional regulator [Thermoanaerobaculia bacterium]